MRQWIGSALVQIMACRLFGAKSLSTPVLGHFNWTLTNKLQWHFNQNTKFFSQENASENIVCEMAAILFRGRWVNEESRVSCQKGPTRHAYAWHIGPFLQDTLVIWCIQFCASFCLLLCCRDAVRQIMSAWGTPDAATSDSAAYLGTCARWVIMMTSSNGSIFRVTGLLCGEFIGHRWIPLTKASGAEFDVFFDLRLNKRFSKAVIWDAIALIMTSK